MTVTLLHVVATFECEGCGLPFGVMIYNDAHTKEGETIYELAVENLSCGYSAGPTHSGMCALLDEMPLCSACSNLIYAELRKHGIETKDAKRDWMLTQLHGVTKKRTA